METSGGTSAVWDWKRGEHLCSMRGRRESWRGRTRRTSRPAGGGRWSSAARRTSRRPSMKADSMRSSSSAVSTMPSGRRWRSCAGGGLRLARRSGGKASSNTETYISRDGEGRAYTQARASGWVPSSL